MDILLQELAEAFQRRYGGPGDKAIATARRYLENADCERIGTDGTVTIFSIEPIPHEFAQLLQDLGWELK